METLGYGSNPLTYDGKFISAFDDGFSDLIPDCIIKRNSGVAMRPALATKYSAGIPTATPTDVHEANAFSSPYLYKKKVNFNTCTILPVSTGSASRELGSAVYYSYPSASTDYIYFHLNSSGEYDLTNAGADHSTNYVDVPGESEVVRLKYLGTKTGPSFNLSDFTAVRNVYMPNLTYNANGDGGIHGIFQYSGNVEDGLNNLSTYIQVRYPEPQVRELENFHVPTWGNGGIDDWGQGWANISSVKNVAFNSYNAADGYSDHFPNLKYMENLTANVQIGWQTTHSGLTVRGDNLSAKLFLANSDIWGNVSASVAATASTIDGNIRFNYGDARDPSYPIYSASQLGIRQPTTITLRGNGTDYGTVRSALGAGAVVPSGTYDWSVASGFYLYYKVFTDCTAGNVSVIVE